MKKLKTTSAIACLFFLFAWLGWPIKRDRPALQIHHSQLEFLPDQKITGLQVSFYNEQGQLTHQLQTPAMTHIPHEDTHRFKHPHIIISEPNQPVWEIHARQATALHQQQIIFKQNVRIQHHAFNQHPAGIIKTNSLSYFPRIKKAMTEEEITWIQAGNTIQSQGMTAYLDRQQIDLNQAKAIYASLD